LAKRKFNDEIAWITAMNFATFDLNLLRVFDALMRERSVSRAGTRLGLSQPAVSNALNRLRHAMGDPLFVRDGNMMLPTPLAERLAGTIREALARIEETVSGEAIFEPATADRHFTLLGADFFSLLLMPELSERIARVAPKISLRLLDSARGDVEELLREGTIDVALERPLELPDWIARQALFRAPFAIIAARDHRAIVKAGVKPTEPFPLDLFCALPHAIRSIDGSTHGHIDEALARVDRERRVVLAVPHFQAVAMAVARGRLIAAVPLQYAEAVAEDLGLQLFAPPTAVDAPEIYMYWHRRHERDTAHQWLRRQILDALQSIFSKRQATTSSGSRLTSGAQRRRPVLDAAGPSMPRAASPARNGSSKAKHPDKGKKDKKDK
jgi:DNA-binding transcriptional LysR family regulator